MKLLRSLFGGSLCGSCAAGAAGPGDVSAPSGFGDRTSLQRPLCRLPLHRRAVRLNDLSAVMNTLANRSQPLAPSKRDVRHRAPKRLRLVVRHRSSVLTRCAMRCESHTPLEFPFTELLS